MVEKFLKKAVTSGPGLMVTLRRNSTLPSSVRKLVKVERLGELLEGV
jgi:hypothetical protein